MVLGIEHGIASCRFYSQELLSSKTRDCRVPGRRFNHFLGLSRQASKASSLHLRLLLMFSSILTPFSPSLPSLSRASYFDSSGSFPKMDRFRFPRGDISEAGE